MAQERQERLERLFEAVSGIDGADDLVILPHNDPDPDAIASGVALRHLLAYGAGLSCRIGYRGIIGRAENKALVQYLGQPLQKLSDAYLREVQAVALVDTQPGAGNNALPPGSTVAAVFDHHPRREETAAAAFSDVRPDVGATSTMLLSYLLAAGIQPDPPLATALFYGIKTDTMGLGRGTGEADVEAYFYLQRRIDIQALVRIEQAQVPLEYFRGLDAALHAARVYDGVVLSYLGRMSRPDMAAEMADLLLRLEGTQWIICAGAYEEDLLLSVRTGERGGAGLLVQQIVGGRGTAGGHGQMAGGQVPLRGESPDQVAQHLQERTLALLDVPPEMPGRPIINRG